MKEAVIALITGWGSTALASLIGAAIVAGFGLLVYLAPKFWDLIASYAETIKSEKIRVRLMDAIMKLRMVTDTLANSEQALLKAEMQKALADGKLETEEVKAIVKTMSAEAMRILTPETSTLKKYLTGDLLQPYIEKYVTSYLVDWAQAKLGVKLQPMNTGTYVPFVPKG